VQHDEENAARQQSVQSAIARAIHAGYYYSPALSQKTGWLGVRQMNCSGRSQSPPEERVIDFPEKKS